MNETEYIEVEDLCELAPERHVHCGGCGSRILLDGESGYELPAGTRMHEGGAWDDKCADADNAALYAHETACEAQMNMVMMGMHDSGGIPGPGDDPRDYETCDHGLHPDCCRTCNGEPPSCATCKDLTVNQPCPNCCAE